MIVDVRGGLEACCATAPARVSVHLPGSTAFVVWGRWSKWKPLLPEGLWISIVHLSAMSNLDHDDHEHIILKRTHDAMAPEPCEVGRECLASHSRVVKTANLSRYAMILSCQVRSILRSAFRAAGSNSTRQPKLSFDLHERDPPVVLGEDLPGVPDVFLLLQPLDQGFMSKALLVPARRFGELSQFIVDLAIDEEGEFSCACQSVPSFRDVSTLTHLSISFCFTL